MKKLNKRLGDILIDENLLTKEQLDIALAEQKKTHHRLGHTLIDLNYITEEQLLNVLTEQFQIPALKLDKTIINPKTVKLIPYEICKKHNIIPFLLHNNELTIATVDPFNLDFIKEVEFISAYDVKLLLTTEKSIQDAIQTYFVNIQTNYKNDQNRKLEFSEPNIKIPQFINSFFMLALKLRAKELHLEHKQEKLTIIFFADQVQIKTFKIDTPTFQSLLIQLKIMANIDINKQNTFLEGFFQTKIKKIPIYVRIYFFPTHIGETVTIKLSW